MLNFGDILSNSVCVAFGNFSNFTDSFDYDYDEGSSNSQSSYHQIHCWQQHKHYKCYTASSVPLRTPSTNKHKQRLARIHIHFNNDGDSFLAPEIQVPDDDDSVDSGGYHVWLLHPMIILLTQ